MGNPIEAILAVLLGASAVGLLGVIVAQFLPPKPPKGR